MNEPETSLEKRVLALEARVMVLEKMTAGLPENSRRVKSFAKDVSESHLGFRADLLALIEDHVEVLKLVHSLVAPADAGKNKLVLTYIRRAESKLDQFQARFAHLEKTHLNLESNGTEHSPQLSKKAAVPRLKSSALNRLVRSAAWWNM